MNNILSVIPFPAKVILGGIEWLASEFRLSDLAELQYWIARQIPNPFDLAAWRIQHGKRDREWKQILSMTIDNQQLYPPEFGSPTAAMLLESAEGSIVQMFISLRRAHPTFTLEVCRSLHAEVTVAEYAQFCRIAWGTSPISVMMAIVDGASPPGNPPDWPMLWHRYITEANGSAPPFGDLTISQFRAWKSGGKPSDGSIADRDDWMQIAERRRQFFSDDGGV